MTPESTPVVTLAGAAPAKRSAAAHLGSIFGRTVFWVAVVELILVLVFGLLSPNGHVFWTKGSFQNIAIDASEVVPLAAAVSLLLGAGELDISLGANIILSSVLGGRVMIAVSSTATLGVYRHVLLGIVAGLVVCCATGATLGLVNGLIVTKMKVNSFITTLGTLGIATGCAYIASNGQDLGGVPNTLQLDFGVRSLGGILPYPALVALGLVVLLWLVVAFTRFGLHTLSLGSSRAAAHRAGLKVDRHLISLFVLVGAFGGFVGFIDLSRFATTNVGGHVTDALQAIAGSVIGGTSMFGGSISIFGALIGSMLSVILSDGLQIVNVQAFYQLIAVGVVLIIAVFIDQRRQRDP